MKTSTISSRKPATATTTTSAKNWHDQKRIPSGGGPSSISLVVVSLVLVISLTSSTSTSLLEGYTFTTQDSVVIQAAPEHELQVLDEPTGESRGTRKKRQFQGFPFQFPGGGISGFPQFPPGWPFIQVPQGQPGQQQPGFPGFPAAPTHPPMTTPTPSNPGGGSCMTRNGVQGRCTSFRQCYPVVYSSVEGEEEQFRNPVLAALLREASGPCDSHSASGYFMFRADVQFRQNMICCGDSSTGVAPTNPPQTYPKPDEYPVTPPHVTQRPPWAHSTTTQSPWPPTQRISTTTMTSTSSPPYPNHPSWPPQIPTHPPNHTPATHPPNIWAQPPTQRTQPTAPPTHPTQPSNPWTQWTQWTQRTTPAPVIQSTPVYPQPPPSASSCGFTKIVGGVQATKGEFPWLVGIMKKGKQFCGGSLIDSQWILSAAHCFQPIANSHSLTEVQIHIGDYDLYSNADGPVTIKRVAKLIMHSGFSHQTLHNDIALLKLDSPVQMGSNGNNNIQPICLGSSGGIEGQSATVAGWGGLFNNGPQPSTYRKVDMPIWSNSQCAAKYGHYAPGGITSHMVCAGSTTKDACRGDSGGPLMRNNGGRWEQIGIVSWGIGCGQYPGVYTRVDHYMDWIARNRVA